MPEDFVKQSKKNWTPRCEHATESQLTIGCLQRIASATELMCKDREKLERDLVYMRNSRDMYRKESEQLQRKLVATKGVVTRLKNKIKAQ